MIPGCKTSLQSSNMNERVFDNEMTKGPAAIILVVSRQEVIKWKHE